MYQQLRTRMIECKFMRIINPQNVGIYGPVVELLYLPAKITETQKGPTCNSQKNSNSQRYINREVGEKTILTGIVTSQTPRPALYSLSALPIVLCPRFFLKLFFLVYLLTQAKDASKLGNSSSNNNCPYEKLWWPRPPRPV